MMRKFLWFVLPLFMLLTACGSENIVATRVINGNNVPDACDLLGEADFKEHLVNLGTLTRSSEASADGLFSSCSWQTSDATQFISLSIWRGEGSAGVADQFLALQRDGLGRQYPVDSFGTDTILAGTEFAWSLGWRSNDSLAALITAIGTGLDDVGMINLGEKVEARLN